MPDAQAAPASPPAGNQTGGAGTTAAPRDQAPQGATTAPDAATTPQPLTEGAALASILAKDQALGDIAQPLATKLATASKTQTDFDSQYADVGLLRHEAIAAFLEVGQATSATQTVGSPDPIAVQKFADIDSEAHLSDAGLKDKFYLNLVTEMKKPSFTDRTRTYDAMKAAAPPAEFGFKGNPIPVERITPLSSRNQSVDKLYDINTIAAEIDTAIEQPLLAAHARPDTVTTKKADRALRLKAYRHLIAARDPLTTVDKGQPISKYAAWYAPGEISVPPGDNTTNYARMMRLGALQPEWYPNGTVVLNIQRTLEAGARDIRKPTAFDGLMSVLWVSRNLGEDDYGVTGGGLGEFLEKGVTYNEVTSATAVIPSDDFLADIQRVTTQVNNAQPGSTPTEELARGNGQGTSILNTAPEARGMYNDILSTTAGEHQNPSVPPVAPGAAQPTTTLMPAAGPRQTPAPAAAAPAAPVAAAPGPASASPASAAAGVAAPAPAANPDVSRHATDRPPADWQGRVVASGPSTRVAPDDPGHTYNLLDDGRVVATTTPMFIDPATAAVARRALTPVAMPSAREQVGPAEQAAIDQRASDRGGHTEARTETARDGSSVSGTVAVGASSMAAQPDFETAALQFEKNLGAAAFNDGLPAAVAMSDKAKAYIVAKVGGRWEATNTALETTLKQCGSDKPEWSGSVGLAMRDLMAVFDSGNLATRMNHVGQFFYNILANDMLNASMADLETWSRAALVDVAAIKVKADQARVENAGKTGRDRRLSTPSPDPTSPVAGQAQSRLHTSAPGTAPAAGATRTSESVNDIPTG